MGKWIGTCQANYNKKTQNMKDKNIMKLWEKFINDKKYQKYFLSQYDGFINNLNKVKIYIDINKKRPSQHSKDKEIKSMGAWIGQKINNYTKKMKNMKDENIYNLWTNFINDPKYKDYF